MEQGQMRMLDEPEAVVEAMRANLSEKYRLLNDATAGKVTQAVATGEQG